MRIPSTTAPSPLAAHDRLVVRIDARADLAAAAALPRGAARRTVAYQALRANAAVTQQAALAALQPLRDAGVVTSVRSLHLPNALVVDANGAEAQQAVRDALAGTAHVGEIRRDVRFLAPPVDLAPVDSAGITVPPRSWALDAVHAPDAWQRGARGRGITIGIVDTGANVDHPAVTAAYRGTAADGSRSHDHNWFDGIDHAPQPVDADGHGTQVASVAVGAKIGIAPDARFIAARAIRSGYNSTVGSLEALQWMLAPTRVDGSDPRPELGADIVNNSWGTSNGRDTFFQETYDGLRAAGIEVTTATGNAGAIVGNVSAPASYPGFLSVGATDRTGQVADFSSRGPSPLPNPSGARTPALAAPGLMVPTAKGADTYVYSSGTSIASPIVAGSLAALMSIAPDATREQLVGALTSTAVDIDVPGPDDASGAGRIDLAAAVERLAVVHVADGDVVEVAGDEQLMRIEAPTGRTSTS